jgi:hypothetical protein
MGLTGSERLRTTFGAEINHRRPAFVQLKRHKEKEQVCAAERVDGREAEAQEEIMMLRIRHFSTFHSTAMLVMVREGHTSMSVIAAKGGARTSIPTQRRSHDCFACNDISIEHPWSANRTLNTICLEL